MLQSADRWGGGEGERPFLPRAFSVLRTTPAPGGRELQFLIEDVGPGTRRLCELERGDELLLVGPLGNGFAAPREDRRPLLVGGGVGIAPLAIWQDELDSPTDPPALLGFRDAEHAAGAALLASPIVATDDGSVGHHGPVTDLLADELDEVEDRFEVYACGPPAMLEAVRAICAERGVPAQLALESGDGLRLRGVLRVRGADRRRLRAACAVDGPVRRRAPRSTSGELGREFRGRGMRRRMRSSSAASSWLTR